MNQTKKSIRPEDGQVSHQSHRMPQIKAAQSSRLEQVIGRDYVDADEAFVWVDIWCKNHEDEAMQSLKHKLRTLAICGGKTLSESRRESVHSAQIYNNLFDEEKEANYRSIICDLRVNHGQAIKLEGDYREYRLGRIRVHSSHIVEVQLKFKEPYQPLRKIYRTFTPTSHIQYTFCWMSRAERKRYAEHPEQESFYGTDELGNLGQGFIENSETERDTNAGSDTTIKGHSPKLQRKYLNPQSCWLY